MARVGLLVVMFLAFAAAVVAGGGHRHRHRRGRSARLQLVRAAPHASLAERAEDDRHRHAYISGKLAASRRRRAAETTTSPGAVAAEASAFAMPLTSGAYTGTGQYFVRFRVGTPAQPFVLVADTGSDLTWVKCRGASPSDPSPSSSPRLFRPSDSNSWSPIPCSSDTCTSYVPFSLANCSTPAPGPCSYDYRYKDNSSARGVVGTDSATVALSGGGADKKAKLQEVVLGCTTSYDGQSFQASDGVLSLGNSNISFASRAAARFGGRFSYCLVDHLAPRNATSYLTFGPGPADSASSASAPPSSRTPLLLDARMRPFYAVTVDAITVAGEALDIPGEVWDVEQSGGAILDSGTSLTILATPAYRAVIAALSRQLAGVPRVSMDPFDYCYNWTSSSASGSAPPAIPRLAVRFAGSAMLEPPAKSYVIDAAPGVKCIGLQEGAWPGVSVIGNILQQEHLWEFDLANRWLRDTPCTHSSVANHARRCRPSTKHPSGTWTRGTCNRQDHLLCATVAWRNPYAGATDRLEGYEEQQAHHVELLVRFHQDNFSRAVFVPVASVDRDRAEQWMERGRTAEVDHAEAGRRGVEVELAPARRDRAYRHFLLRLQICKTLGSHVVVVFCQMIVSGVTVPYEGWRRARPGARRTWDLGPAAGLSESKQVQSLSRLSWTPKGGSSILQRF